MNEQCLHMQRNGSNSGYYATHPPVSSKDICPGTGSTQYYQSWGLAMIKNITAQRNTVGQKKGFQGDHIYFLTQRHGRSLTISQLYRGWFSQERRPEIQFLYQGLKCTAQPEDETLISMQMLRHLGSSIMQGSPNVKSVEPPMAPQKQWKMVTSQTQLMITTKRSFHESTTQSSIYRIHWTTRVSNAKGLW